MPYVMLRYLPKSRRFKSKMEDRAHTANWCQVKQILNSVGSLWVSLSLRAKRWNVSVSIHSKRLTFIVSYNQIMENNIFDEVDLIRRYKSCGRL